MLIAMLLSLCVIDPHQGYWTATVKHLETVHYSELNSIKSNPAVYQSVYNNFYGQAQVVDIYDLEENP